MSYSHNHYVPKWYQKRFLSSGKTRYHYLDLQPETSVNNGHIYKRKELHNWGPELCFAQDDLYTTKWGGIENRDIEKFFFGSVDSKGQKAVEHFASFRLNDETHDAFNALVPYMSIQKLRTPKGLAWLENVLKPRNRNETLFKLQQLSNLFCAIWTEAVWQIADASKSPTKFIISDHPVVAYNRECFPGSKWCIGSNDPDIRWVATHTYFPISLDKVLIMTNLSWVRDPFQNPVEFRPNPKFLRSSRMFNLLRIQHERYLSEEEVLEINYITKKRAFRYIAAAEKEWLYPERYLRSTNWRKLGDGYLLMPDPRHIHGGGTIVVGYNDGSGASWDAYGHRPGQKAYEDKNRENREWRMMQKFKAEWAATYGPDYRGVLYDLGFSSNDVRRTMSEKWHQQEVTLDRKYLKESGERARRRRLKR
ncbi:MAG: DUF4238 domain-containing protein [Holosporales bacterium]|jgi:hypothetical protein